MKSLIVGCSSTHGSDTVTTGYNPENIKYSWANLLSQKLGYEPDNQAWPGCSNEYIFHQAVDSLDNYDMLIVGWTSLARETWKCDRRTWQLFAGTAYSTVDKIPDGQWVQIQKRSGITLVSEDENLFDTMQQAQRFFIQHKFDRREFMKKLIHYRQTLKTLCQYHGIKYIDANIIVNVFSDVPCINIPGRHPTIEEHKTFAQTMFEFYNEHLG